ncbi:ABC transport system permease [Thermosulfidibacter takaii ABI70S6]|uniref:ABC transport system permease n=1 Tax=Thermosulfidibacter takaii (strain DSM 17441 / JCM 13301 / NBRC 103674 / ABI70S6) TaxID=1298851 RepID=A0A0S3QTA3_THET7|nr:ABC transporter permease [Thermosulfidibacter takaii]BAT71560.1 ABC transport system permease [Thermosulfidibacter takaii ABI70S6]
MNSHEIFLVALGYIFIGTAILTDCKIGVGLWKEYLIASIICLVQLVGIGFVILVLLKLGNEALNIALVLSFLFNGARIARKRFKIKSYTGSRILPLVFLSLSLVSFCVLTLYLFFGLMNLKANSMIPLSGLVAAAGMRSLSLGFDHYKTLVSNQREIILEMASLGVKETNIFKLLLKDVLKHILLPAVDTLKAAGIVHIPGIMVGLLVAGILPIKAAVVQFVILTTLIFVYILTPSVALYAIVRKHGFRLEE